MTRKIERPDYDFDSYLSKYATHHDIPIKEALNHAMVCEAFKCYVEEKVKEQHKRAKSNDSLENK